MAEKRTAIQRAIRTARWGQGFAVLAFLVYVIATSVNLYGAVTMHPELVTDVADVFDHTKTSRLENGWQYLVVTTLLSAPDFFGMTMMILAFLMFRSFGRDGALQLRTATRLRSIGWCIFALAPSRIIGDVIAGAIYVAWTTPGTAQISLSVEDTDFYAVLIGLIIVATGHIMVQAVEFSDENKSFV